MTTKTDPVGSPHAGTSGGMRRILNSLTLAAQAVAIPRWLEFSLAGEYYTPAQVEAQTAKAYEQFIEAAAAIADELAPLLSPSVLQSRRSGAQYLACPVEGKWVVFQKMSYINSAGPGTMLIPGEAYEENFLQLLVDLPELLELLGLSA